MSCLMKGKSHGNNISALSVLRYHHSDDCSKKQTKQIRNKGTKTKGVCTLVLACFQFCHYPSFWPPKDRSMSLPPVQNKQSPTAITTSILRDTAASRLTVPLLTLNGPESSSTLHWHCTCFQERSLSI